MQEEAGYPRLSTVTKPYIQKFLKEQDSKPFKIKYYCEKRDPDFESKCMRFCWFISRLKCSFDENGDLIVPDDYKLTIRYRMMRKPGIQAISIRHRIYAIYQNMGKYIVMQNTNVWEHSLYWLALICLTGEAIPLVSETHKSSDFIEFLKILDKKYPSQDTIRIILDNHSAHTSKETRRFLDTMPKDV